MDDLKHLQETLLEVEDLGSISPEEFVSYYVENKNRIEKTVVENGAIKFQGIQIASQESFQYIMDSIGQKFLEYIDGNSPRTKLSSNVYTSTEYSNLQKITMHSELSYSANWPKRLFFSCIQPSESGGETLLADNRTILRAMNPDIIKEVESRGVLYIRNLHGGAGIGPSWQDTFETKDKKQLKEYCDNLSIKLEWTGDDSVRLKQFSKGIIVHRFSGEKVWFNQIDQFHPCHLGEELYNSLSFIYEAPEDFPTYVTYGDGGKIEESVIKEIIETIEMVTIAPIWDKNELLIVDNELFSHGRNPFTGNRKVLVSMSL